MWLLILLIASQVLTDKIIWNGDDHKLVIAQNLKLMDLPNIVIDYGLKNLESKEILKVIDVIPHMRLKNVKILNFKIDDFKVGMTGVYIFADDKNNNHQLLGTVNKNNESFYKKNVTSCELFHCEVGLYLLHYSANEDFVQKNVHDFYGAFYLKLITNDMHFKISKFEVLGDEFPLVTCPFKRWTSYYSDTEFEPFETSGLVFDKFLERQILLPGYQRNEDSNIFICGYLKYSDNSKLTISHEIIPFKKSIFKVKKKDNAKDIWKCGFNHSPFQYIHFIYSKNLQGYHKMRYINYNLLKETYLYYDETLYLYSYKNHVIKSLRTNGIKHMDKMNSIKPVCANKLSPRKAKVTLFSDYNKELLKGNDSIQIMYVKENMLNKVIPFKCKIVVEEGEKIPYLSKFYDRAIETSLISMDKHGNKVVHDHIVFKSNFNGFGKYICEIKPISKNFDDMHFINNLAFITLPMNLSITKINETWQTKSDILIQCQRRLSNIGYIKDMIVQISNKSTYKISNKLNESLFFDENNFVIFKYQDLFAKNITFQNVTTECVYKTFNDMKFKITKHGIVLEKIIINLDPKVQSSSKKTLVLLIVLITIIFVLFALIISLIIFKCIINNRKRKLIHISELERFVSDSSSSSPLSKISKSKNTT